MLLTDPIVEFVTEQIKLDGKIAEVPAGLEDDLSGISVEQDAEMKRRLRGADAGGLAAIQPTAIPVSTTEAPTTAAGAASTNATSTSKVVVGSMISFNDSAVNSTAEPSSSSTRHALGFVTLLTLVTLMSHIFT